jgi:tetratricopeptide (TPR) repeat protein
LASRMSNARRSFLTTPTIGKMPIVGRQRELAILREALHAKLGPITISGDAGIGKSRLAHEAMEMARSSGFEVLAAACFPHDTSIAYAPFRELIRDRRAQALETLLTTDAAQIWLAAVEERRKDIFAAWRHWLETHSPNRALLLCIEDLHWCDEVSLQLLADITLRTLKVPCILLVTFRDEPLPALTSWRASVDRSRRVLDITLGSLTESESVDLLYDRFDDKNALGIELARTLHDLADGYPFFLEELAKLVQGGTRKQQLPRSVTDATRLRLKSLRPAARQLLDLAAVEGRDFDAGFLGRILGMEERGLARSLRSLVDAGFIIERSTERFSFRHPLFRVAVLDQQLARETRDLHRRIAHELAGSQSRDVDALARHWFGAEAWEEALPFALAGGEAAFALGAFRSAKQHWTRAIQATARLGRLIPPAYQHSLGLVCELLEQFDDAQAAYETSLALAKESHDALLEWQSLVSLGRLWTRRDYMRAGVFFQHARRVAAMIDQPVVQAESANAMGSWLLNVGRDAEAVAMHESALPLLHSDQHVAVRAHTLDRLGMANGLAGRLSACVEAYDRAAELWRRLDNPRALATSLQGRAAFGLSILAETVPWSGRSSSDCLADAIEAVQLTERARVPSEEAFARMGLACVHVARDEIGPALAEAEACRRIAGRAGHDEWQVSARFVHALALLRILAVEEAAEALGELLPEAERTGSAWWSTNTRAYLAVACVLCHDTAGAEKVIEARASLLGSAAERRLEWAKAELALLRRNGSAAGAIVDGLLRAPPGDAHAPIPQLLFVRGAALALERRFTSAIRTLERAREAAVDSGGLALLVRIEDALAKLHARQNHRHRAKEASARIAKARCRGPPRRGVPKGAGSHSRTTGTGCST